MMIRLPEKVKNRIGDAESKEAAPLRHMVTPDEALRLVLKTASRQPPQRVPLDEACGLQLAEEMRADRDYPPFPRAMMDGYAVRTSHAGKTVEVVGEIAAGQDVRTQVAEGSCLEIMTGAPCPPGTEAVVQKEHIRRSGTAVTLPRNILAGSHIASQGSECKSDSLILGPGDTLTPMATAVIASFGRNSVLVTRRPSVAVITTGAELITADQEPAPGQIRDSNGPMLVAMARDMGIEHPVHLHAEDRLESIMDALCQSAEKDIVLLTGGVSVGNYDFVPAALEDYKAELVFHKVKQKPGKPMLFARKNEQFIFGLPGNPLACHLCFHRYAAAAIRKMEGKRPMLVGLQGQLTEPVKRKKARTHFIAAHAESVDDEHRGWTIRPVPGVSSADIFASCQANCYVEVPPGNTQIPEGEVLEFTWIGNAPWPN